MKNYFFLAVFFLAVVFLTAFFVPHFDPQAIDHHPLPRRLGIGWNESFEGHALEPGDVLAICRQRSDAGESLLCVLHILPYLAHQRIGVWELFLAPKTLHE